MKYVAPTHHGLDVGRLLLESIRDRVPTLMLGTMPSVESFVGPEQNHPSRKGTVPAGSGRQNYGTFEKESLRNHRRERLLAFGGTRY